MHAADMCITGGIFARVTAALAEAGGKGVDNDLAMAVRAVVRTLTAVLLHFFGLNIMPNDKCSLRGVAAFVLPILLLAWQLGYAQVQSRYDSLDVFI